MKKKWKKQYYRKLTLKVCFWEDKQNWQTFHQPQEKKRRIKSTKLEMKNKRLQEMMQKYKGWWETIMNNYMAPKCINWKKQILRKLQSSNTEPGKNQNYEQPNHKHWNWSCDQKSPQNQKPRTRWLHRKILWNI